MITNIVRTNGLITSWNEGEQSYQVIRAAGRISSIRSFMGKYQDDVLTFNYDGSGNFVGVTGHIQTSILHVFLEEAANLRSSFPSALLNDFISLGVKSDGAGSSDGVLRDLANVAMPGALKVTGIVPRVNTLASLLALATGSGEIMVPSDASDQGIVVQFPTGGTKKIGAMQSAFATQTVTIGTSGLTGPNITGLTFAPRVMFLLAHTNQVNGGFSLSVTISNASPPNNMMHMYVSPANSQSGSYSNYLFLPTASGTLIAYTSGSMTNDGHQGGYMGGLSADVSVTFKYLFLG